MAKKKHPGAPTRAVERLNEAGTDFRILDYEHDPHAKSYGLEAAAKLGLKPEQMFKTLLVDCGGEFVVALVPADHQLSLKAIAKYADVKSAELADPGIAQRRTGYIVGGISPLGQLTEHRTFIDESALEHETIVVSAGKRGLSVELSPLDLAELTDAEFEALRD